MSHERRLHQLLLLALTSPEPNERHAAIDALYRHTQTRALSHTSCGSRTCETPSARGAPNRAWLCVNEEAREKLFNLVIRHKLVFAHVFLGLLDEFPLIWLVIVRGKVDLVIPRCL
jgi:hypothetical protein